MNKEKKIALVGIAAICLIAVFIVGEFYFFNQSISNLEKETQNLQTEITTKQHELSGLTGELSWNLSELEKKNLTLNEVNSEIKKLQSGKRYELHNPIYYEVEDFIVSKDQTNYKQYNEDTFNCVNYAQGVNNNAENRGMRCAFVNLNLSGNVDHALVAFNVQGKGILYYEPQNDQKVSLQIGKDYWADCVSPPPGYYYPRNPDNIIEGYEITW